MSTSLSNCQTLKMNIMQEKSTPKTSSTTDTNFIKKYQLKKSAGIAVGAAVGVCTVPLALSALGFGAGGIAAGSVAAKLMSLSATTGYGAGLVATGQSVGAAGLSLTSSIVLGSGGGSVGKAVTDKIYEKSRL